MRNSVTLIAKHFNLDSAAFMAFAVKNEAKYDLDFSTNKLDPTVSNWYSDKLVNDFKQLSVGSSIPE